MSATLILITWFTIEASLGGQMTGWSHDWEMNVPSDN